MLMSQLIIKVWHAGREFECDFGFVGEGGICVEFGTPGSVCGGGGQPVCAGDDLIGTHSCRHMILSQDVHLVDTICVDLFPEAHLPLISYNCCKMCV